MALHIAFTLAVQAACSGSALATGNVGHASMMQGVEGAWPLWGAPGMKGHGWGGFHNVPRMGAVSEEPQEEVIPPKTHSAKRTPTTHKSETARSKFPPVPSMWPQHLRAEQAPRTPRQAELEKDQEQLKSDAVLFSQLEEEKNKLHNDNEQLVERKKQMEVANDQFLKQAGATKKAAEELRKAQERNEATSNKLAEVKETMEKHQRAMTEDQEEMKKIKEMVAEKASEKDSLLAQRDKLYAENEQLQKELDEKDAYWNKHVSELAAQKKQVLEEYTGIFQSNQDMIQSIAQGADESKNMLVERQTLEKTRSEASAQNQKLHDENAQLVKKHDALSQRNQHLKGIFGNAQQIVDGLPS